MKSARNQEKPCPENDEDYDSVTPDPEADDDKNRVFEIIATLTNLSARHGLTLKRWRKVYTTMLQKTPALNHIEKLRVINIIEADFNLMIGTLWGRR